jgi:hypothetical protein
MPFTRFMIGKTSLMRGRGDDQQTLKGESHGLLRSNHTPPIRVVVLYTHHRLFPKRSTSLTLPFCPPC